MKKKAKTFWNSNSMKQEGYSSIKEYSKFCKMMGCLEPSWYLIKIDDKWYCEGKNLVKTNSVTIPIPCWFIDFDGSLKSREKLPRNTSLLKLIAAYERLKITSII